MIVMKQKKQALQIVVMSGFHRLHRAFKAMLQEEVGVTSIEYALIASLIVVGAAASIALLGGGVGGMWANVASAVSAAM